MLRARAAHGGVLLLLMSGCTLGYSRESFMTTGLPKAAFDMHCEKEKLQVTELSKGSMGVRGCGRQNRYEWADGAGSRGAWVLNSVEDGDKK